MSVRTKWSIDEAYCQVTFSTRYLTIAHLNGVFKIFDASIYTTDKDFTTAEIDFWIDPSSISTWDENRDEHLRSADYLNVQEFREITFVASSMGKPDDYGNHELCGVLTMLGVTRTIKLNAHFKGMQKDYLGNEKAGFTVSGKLNRKDWKRDSLISETIGLSMHEEILVRCELELTNEGQYMLKPEKGSSVYQQMIL